MYTGKTVFSQLMDFLPLHEFRRCVKRYDGNRHVKSFSCLDQLLCMMFAQLSYRESLRDIESCLRAMQNKLYHMGIRSKVSRSTLAEANEKRDWRETIGVKPTLLTDLMVYDIHPSFLLLSAA